MIEKHNEPLPFNPPRTVHKPMCEERVINSKIDGESTTGYFYSYHALREWQLEQEMNKMVNERRRVS